MNSDPYLYVNNYTSPVCTIPIHILYYPYFFQTPSWSVCIMEYPGPYDFQTALNLIRTHVFIIPN